MRIIPVLLLLLACLTARSQTTKWDKQALNTASSADYLTAEEKEVILLVNMARSNPRQFAIGFLESRKGESPEARECYNEMVKTQPLQVLLPSKALSLAARDHAIDMGETGDIGHVSSDGKTATQRVEKYGSFTGLYNGPWENCSYGLESPLDIVLQLLIDKDVPGRGHRKNILHKDVRYIGTSIKPHKTYRVNCVMDFADEVTDK